jgi:hypothetical protein
MRNDDHGRQMKYGEAKRPLPRSTFQLGRSGIRVNDETRKLDGYQTVTRTMRRLKACVEHDVRKW